MVLRALGLAVMSEAMWDILQREMRVLIMLLLVSMAASSGQLLSGGFMGLARRLDGGSRQSKGKCRSVALRVMKPPALAAYEECFVDKIKGNTSTHDWSIPGAEVKAQLDCWCHHNLTETMREYHCCDHDDIYPMCSVNCKSNCDSPVARDCIQNCPSMCFEAAEYVVDPNLCKNCDWVKCWPTLDCLLSHAAQRVADGDLNRTCHDAEFVAAPVRQEYHKCWYAAPKHSSHWNVLGAIVHCICREGMQKLARDTHCCESVTYGGGACNLECVGETECATQTAQTCIHGCQLKCPALDLAPSQQCVADCLNTDSPCRKYVSCRPPATGNYVCNDGRWPESSSGCCENNVTGIIGCPRLCKSQRMWRLDRQQGVPWWARWNTGKNMIAQCTCHECPESVDAIASKLVQTIQDDLWENGQRMLLDIARREGLVLGPNRRMQELMHARNEAIVKITNAARDGESNLEELIASINARYSMHITRAARTDGDDPVYLQRTVKQGGKAEGRDDSESALMLTIIVCTCVLLLGFAMTACYVMYKKKQITHITSFDANQQVVIGQPVAGQDAAEGGVATGAPVTVSAPMKNHQSPTKSVT